MCTKLQTDGVRFWACRRCDACLWTLRCRWITRAMCEVATNKNTLAITLTYDDKVSGGVAASRFFRYSDVKNFVKRLRRSVAYHLKIKACALRFIVCGEMGEKKGRCHWHILLFSDVDLLSLGKFKRPYSGAIIKNDNRKAIVSAAHERRGKRILWSLWPHGHVVIQEPDQQGVAYVVQYAHKSLLASDKSEGEVRFMTSAGLAVSHFRMSKSPPIGWDFVWQRISDLASRDLLPTSLQFKPPNCSYVWHLHDRVRARVLLELHKIHIDIIERTGRPSASFTTLLSSLSDNDKEILLNGIEEITQEDIEIEWAVAKARRADDQYAFDKRQIVRQCGSTIKCMACVAGDLDEWRAEYGVETYFPHGGKKIGYRLIGDQTGVGLRALQTDGKAGGCNKGCRLSDHPSRTKYFNKSA